MSWNFKVDGQSAVRDLIKMSTKYAQDIDMDTVSDQAKKDAQLFATNPENQKKLVDLYDASASAASAASGASGVDDKVRQAFGDLEKQIEDACKEQMEKSMPHLQVILDKYESARPIFEKIYKDIFKETLNGEARDKWIKTRPPEAFTVKGEGGLEDGAGSPAPVKPSLPIPAGHAHKRIAVDAPGHLVGADEPDEPYDAPGNAVAKSDGKLSFSNMCTYDHPRLGVVVVETGGEITLKYVDSKTFPEETLSIPILARLYVADKAEVRAGDVLADWD